MLSKRINIQLTGTFIAAAGFLIFGVLVVIYGYSTTQGAFEWTRLVEQLYSNFGIELVSIALTVLVIESLNQRRAVKDRKAELISQLRSSSHDFALEAVRVLSEKGWVEDGSLRKVGLGGAKLQTAYLWNANLQGVNLMNANLENSNLMSSDLHGAILWKTNLQGADLQDANLQESALWDANLCGANLGESNLQGARLSGIGISKFDENTTLPDGTKWTPDTDMERFTNPNHPQFWRSDSPTSPAYGGK